MPTSCALDKVVEQSNGAIEMFETPTGTHDNYTLLILVRATVWHGKK
jgi:hypothetical protein